jgi:PHD/YefM family antitoxin component YafN of YafNO toxin-antitoxin module
MILKHPNAQFVVKNGKTSAVILPIADYEELMEDLQDLATMTKRKDEPLIPLAEVKKRLKKTSASARIASPSRRPKVHA